MRFLKSNLAFILSLPVALALLGVTSRASAQGNVKHAKSEIPMISAEELKSKMGKNERLTIIDVRDSDSYAASDNKIKGAVHVKLRRLKTRLAFLPFKNVPREQEAITYCACPREESSLAAAQILLDAGFKHVYILKGGWNEWLKVSGQVEPRPKAL